MNITSLPEDCIHAILHRLPLSTLLNLRQVCPLWHRQIFHLFLEHKRSLKLFEARAEVAHFAAVLADHNVDHVVDFDLHPLGPVDDVLVIRSDRIHQAVRTLPSLFPATTQLMVNCRPLFDDPSLLPALLGRWPALISLVLSARMQPLPDHVLTALHHCLPALRRLHLTQLFKCRIPEPLPLLSRLTHFSLVHYFHDCVPVLGDLGPDCRELILYWIHLDHRQMARLLHRNPGLATAVSHLSLGFLATSEPENRLQSFHALFRLICARFAALERFNVMFTDHLPLTAMLPELDRLPALRHLEVYLSGDELPCSGAALSSVAPLSRLDTLHLEIHDVSARQFRHLIAPAFPAIKTLTLRCHIEDAGELRSLRRVCLNPAVFPRLTELRLQCGE